MITVTVQVEGSDRLTRDDIAVFLSLCYNCSQPIEHNHTTNPVVGSAVEEGTAAAASHPKPAPPSFSAFIDVALSKAYGGDNSTTDILAFTRLISQTLPYAYKVFSTYFHSFFISSTSAPKVEFGFLCSFLGFCFHNAC